MQSERWMFTSPGAENEYKKPSVTREHYAAVIEAKAREKSDETERERKRRKLESFMWGKMTERTLELIKKQQEQAKKVQACSTYEESFAKQGFTVKELGTDIDEKLQQKYPLYTDTAKSIHLREIDRTKAKDTIHKPDSAAFRRDSRFTSRLSNPLDIHEPVGPGHFAYV